MIDLNSILLEGRIENIEPEYDTTNSYMIFDLTNKRMCHDQLFRVRIPIKFKRLITRPDMAVRIVGHVDNIAGNIYVTGEHVEAKPYVVERESEEA